MKSLAERKAFREKQRAQEKGRAQSQSDESVPDGASDEDFDATDFVGRKQEDVIAELGNLTPERLALVEAAEKSGKDRTGIANAIAELKNKKTTGAAGWSSTAG
ncbi:hypothetical protein [Xanthomonas phage XAJ2]|uniref:Uncharacterized protein n=1 Tax=Xanthomonas phage XAJ2 TaxID=1775249 RepID=A0A1I9L2E2_9CAUD|nr:hypothetical protein [Xanthomonas phage XAJ2]